MNGVSPIGVDFDNTLVCYDHVFTVVGVATGVLAPGFAGGKAAVREAVRALPNGEALWQGLQAIVYGPEIGRAMPFDGVRAFLAACRHSGCPVVVISHKTRFAAADPDGTDLRVAGLAWLEAQGLFDPASSPLSSDQVYFTDTRAEKVATIRRLGCRAFVDDLEEVFRDPGYPTEVPGVLFTNGNVAAPDGPWRRAAHWREVADVLLAA